MPKINTPVMEQYTFKVPAPNMARLRLEASREGITFSAYLRNMVRDHIKALDGDQ